jgi:glycine dehydrogenase subunit 1
MQGMGVEIIGDEHLPESADDLPAKIDANTAMIAVQYPDFFGRIRDWTALGQAAHAAGALLCVVVNPLALGLLRPPSEFDADIVVGDGQPLGIPMSFGGPTLGHFTVKQDFVRKMAGRLVGETVDSRGQRGYVLTLTPREQHIRREKATSNICTNVALMALASAVYLSLMGKQGLRQVAELCYHKAHYAAAEIDQLPGYTVKSAGTWYCEFVVECPRPVAGLNARLLEEYGFIGGYDLGRDYPHLANHMLVCVTETLGRDEIDEFVEALKALGAE